MTVAQTILQQLGGSRFVTMTGSKNFVGREDGLSFKIGSNAAKISHVRVTLTPADEYKVEFLKIRGASVTTAAVVDGAYCDNLADVIGEQTGLAVRL